MGSLLCVSEMQTILTTLGDHVRFAMIGNMALAAESTGAEIRMYEFFARIIKMLSQTSCTVA